MTIFYRKLPRFQYMRARSIEEAFWLLDEHGQEAVLLSGGTDLLVQLKGRQMRKPECVIDLKGIAGLDQITYDEKAGLSIGALTTINTITESELVARHFPILTQAGLLMASPQVRNRGTFAGNLCSAVPSADSAPPLLALDAKVRLKTRDSERIVPLRDFFKGPRETMIEPDEIMTSIEVDPLPPGATGTYLKLSPRHSMDLAVVGVAAVGVYEAGVCKDIRIALGAVAPTPIRVGQAEAVLAGKKATAALINEAAEAAANQCRPIDDHRASMEYRRDMVYVMTKRALTQVLN
jgi:CO/xanthine dehydrogenase FAD-binding subunit